MSSENSQSYLDQLIGTPFRATILVQDGISKMDYSVFVEKLKKPLSPIEDLLHMGVGASGEVSGELLDAIKAHYYYGKPLDRENVVEEIGDAIFYLQGIMNNIGASWEEVIDSNVAKLTKRYHKLHFSQGQATERADKNANAES